MSKKKVKHVEEYVQKFDVGSRYRIIHYPTDKVYDLRIIDRKDNWVTVSLCGKEKQVRIYSISNPKSESILLDDFSAVYAYRNCIY